MKDYEKLILEIRFFDISDIITESNSNDNDYDDIDWEI